MAAYNYQTVLQCLYSQCHTAQFGSALHHALSKCNEYPPTSPNSLPPLFRHQGLHRRATQNQALVSAKPLISAHQAFASAQAIQSVPRRFDGGSAAANVARPTRSAFFSAARASSRALATQSTPLSGLDDVGFNESIAPIKASTADVLPSQAAPASVVSGFGSGGPEPHVRSGKPYILPTGTAPFPTSLNSSQIAASRVNGAPVPTATPPIVISSGFYPSIAFNASTFAKHLPSTVSSRSGSYTTM